MPDCKKHGFLDISRDKSGKCSRCEALAKILAAKMRLALLEIVGDAWLKDHQELKNFTSGFGPKQECTCKICEMAREALNK